MTSLRVWASVGWLTWGRRFVSAVWFAVFVYFSFSITAFGAQVVKGDSAYLCKYGSDCMNNSWAKRCCRDVGVEGIDPVFVCSALCR